MFDEIPTGPVAPYERLGLSRAQMARELGISVQWLRKLMAAERAQVVVEMAPPSPELPHRRELPHVPIVSGPSRERWHYRLDHDQSSRLPDGPFWIDTARGPSVRHRDERLGEKPAEKKDCKHKHKPPRPPKGKDFPSC